MRRSRDAPETVLIQADGSVLPHRIKTMDYIPPLVGSTSQSALTPITSTTTTAADSAELPSAFANMDSTGVSADELSDSLNLPVASHISPPQLGTVIMSIGLDADIAVPVAEVVVSVMAFVSYNLTFVFPYWAETHIGSS